MINLSTIQEQGLLPDVIDDTNPDDVFVGFFKFNKNEDYCLIKRIFIDGDGITKITYPNGQFDYRFNWGKRKTYAYRHRDFSISTIIRGFLYNWFAVTDVRNIASNGWHVPSSDDYNSLSTLLGGENIAGGKLKESATYWKSPNEGTNESGFNGRGTAMRVNYFPHIDYLNQQSFLWTSLELSPTNAVTRRLLYSDSTFPEINSEKYYGCSLRLIKDSSDVGSGMYIGNDNRAYRTVKIGTQVWLADNLAETKYRNGDSIPTVTDNAAWAALTTGAKCAYNNDESYV